MTTEPPAALTRLQVGHATVKWTARVLSAPLIILLGVIVIGCPGGKDLFEGLYGIVGLLAAWRWELFGGGWLFLATSVCALVLGMQEEPWGFYIWWLVASLFLVSGFLKRAANPAASPQAIQIARILALVFAVLALASIGGCFASGAYQHFNG